MRSCGDVKSPSGGWSTKAKLRASVSAQPSPDSCSLVRCHRESPQGVKQHNATPPLVPTGAANFRCRATSAPPSTPDVSHILAELSAVELKQFNPSKQKKFDLVVAGGGPSGLAVADRVSEAGFTVCIVDPSPLANWPNNYGVWVDEFEMMGLDDCLEVVWPRVTVMFDEDKHGEVSLDRPYGRVDRPKLKKKLLGRCLEQGVTFFEQRVDSVTHGDGMSRVRCGDGTEIAGTLVLDATGHARKLVEYDKKFDPGYQGAYGVLVEVESHPFDVDAMLFMDWRDGHMQGQTELKRKNDELPTFLYVMPFSKTKIFLEETSLVARPAISFDDLKERLKVRMEWLGLKVLNVEEEECCLIPMGGELPMNPQRTLGIGGTAGMVHPATGYMVSRMLGVAPTLADAITDQLSFPRDKAKDIGSKHVPLTEEEANEAAIRVWQAIWPIERIWQREFFWFGMEVVLKLNLLETREFFAAFFALSDYHWQGFLSSRHSFTELLGFGWALFLNANNATRANLLVKGAPGLAVMISRLALLSLSRK